MIQEIRLGARLRASRKSAGFKTSRAFIKKYGIPASTYSQHESGARIPDNDSLKFYSKVFGVNINWLKSGIGQPFSYKQLEKNLMSEELFTLSKNKLTNHPINKKIFTEILSNLLKELEPHIKLSILKKTIIKALQIYNINSS